MAEAAREEELRGGLGVILASDEEVGSKYGIQYLLKAEPNLIKPGDLVIVPDAGSQMAPGWRWPRRAFFG